MQISRLGLPLINELLMPLASKDYYSSMAPAQDAVFFSSPRGSTALSNPEIASLLGRFYGLAVPAAGRTDLADLLRFQVEPGGPGTPSAIPRQDVFLGRR